jgi:hypothetical protein
VVPALEFNSPRSGRVSHGLRADVEEFLEVTAGDEAASSDLDVGQVALPHLVVQQIAG